MSAKAKDCLLEIDVVAGEYHKYRIWGFRNPKFNESCGRLLDLKDEKHPKHDLAVRHFGQKVAQHLKGLISRKEPIVVALVPGHSQNSLSAGLKEIVSNHLKPAFNIVNKKYALRRHTTTGKRASGGDRSMENVLDTVEVVEGTVTKGCTVVLIDDVTTTGNSMRACASLLKAAGAGKVIGIALMNTVND